MCQAAAVHRAALLLHGNLETFPWAEQISLLSRENQTQPNHTNTKEIVPYSLSPYHQEGSSEHRA